MPASRHRWADRDDARLMFILSSERSGSTLLRFLLGEHSRLVSPQELFILRYPDFATWRARKPVAMESLLEFFRLVREPERQVGRFCAATGLEREARVGTLGSAPEMNPHLGDPTFHQHRQVDAEMADDWLARYQESWLRPETLALMAELEVRRPRVAPPPSASQTTR